MKILGICGYDNTGKSTLASLLLAIHHYIPMEISDTLMKSAIHLGWNGTKDDTEYGRKFLIWLGYSLKERYGTNYLVKLMIENAKKANIDKIVIPSIRSRCEADYVKAQGGHIIKITRDIEDNTAEFIKADIDKITPDILIKNDYSIQELKVMVEGFNSHKFPWWC